MWIIMNEASFRMIVLLLFDIILYDRLSYMIDISSGTALWLQYDQNQERNLEIDKRIQ